MTEQTNNNYGDNKQAGIGRNVLTFVACLGVLLLLWLIVQLKSLVVLIVISIVLATGLAPMVCKLERINLPKGKHIPRGIAILLVYIFAAVVLSGAIALIVVPVVKESYDFAGNAPQYIQAVQTWLGDLHARYSWIPDYAGLLQRSEGQLGSAGQYLLGSIPAAFGFFGGIISILTVSVITYYLLSSREDIRTSFLAMVPERSENAAGLILSTMATTMGAWLRGQLLLAGIIGALTAGAMLILGVPYPFVIAVVGAIGELVPMIGPFAAAVPAVLITGVSGSIPQLIASVIFFAILANVEGNILAPKIMQRQVGLSPLMTILAIIAGAALMGVVGALLAIPIAAAFRVLYIEAIAPAVRRAAGRK